MDLLILTLCSTLLFGVLFYQLLQHFFSAPYVPSSHSQVKQILSQFVKEDMSFIDLGSGDGMVVFSAAELGAKASGIDTNFLLTLTSKARNIGKRNKGKFYTGSMFRHDLSEYDVIYTYLYPKMLEQLLPKLEQEMKSGAILISNSFSLPKEAKLSKQKVNKFYIYRKI